MRTFIARVISSVGAFTVGVCLANHIAAADLRSTVGNRTVVKTATLEPIPQGRVADDAPPARAHQPAPYYQQQPQMGDMEYQWGDDGYGAQGCDDWGACGPCRNWATADFIYWSTRGRSLPPLAASGTPTPNTVLYGGNDVGIEMRPGGRFELGRWVDDVESLGYGIRGYFLGDSDTAFNTSSPATGPALGIPFINVSPAPVGNGGQDYFLVADPNGGPAYSGSIDVKTTSRVYGGDIFMRWQVCNTCETRVDFLLGYQYARLDESLVITGVLNEPAVTVRDTFKTTNEFGGVSLGLLYQWWGPCVHVDVLTKIGLGRMHETLSISDDGSTNGGLFARSSNIGFYNRNSFAVIPELGLNCVVPLRCGFEFNVGYSFLLYSTVLQPGAQLDPQVNLTPNTAPTRPAATFHDNDFWLHGVNFGLTKRF